MIYSPSQREGARGWAKKYPTPKSCPQWVYSGAGSLAFANSRGFIRAVLSKSWMQVSKEARRGKHRTKSRSDPPDPTFRMARVAHATLARSVRPVPRKRESGRCKVDLAYAAQVHTLLGMPQIIVVLHCQPAFRRAPEHFG